MKESKDVNVDDVGRRIMLLRNELGYSRESVAKQAHISTKFLYEIEMGHKGFSAHTLLKLADALDTNMDYIMIGGKRRQDKYTLDGLEKIDSETMETVENLLRIAHDLVCQKEIK